jgi:hypothetical protein
MNKQTKKYGLLILAFLICACLNYNPQMLFETNYRHWGWNFSLIATFLILIVFRFRDPLDWKIKLGINFKLADWFGFLVLTILLLFASYYLVDYLSEINGYSFRPKIIHYKDYNSPDFPFFPILGDYLYYIPETFNEEIFIGALLLMGLERNFKKLNKNAIVIGVALIFSLMHQALYKWSPVQPGLLLSTQTILTLFFVGILRNSLILKTRKISYSWAIHLSFNMIFFSGFYINNSTDEFASEPERFNIVLGNLTMVLITGLLATMSMIWLNMNRLNSKRQIATGYNNAI